MSGVCDSKTFLKPVPRGGDRLVAEPARWMGSRLGPIFDCQLYLKLVLRILSVPLEQFGHRFSKTNSNPVVAGFDDGFAGVCLCSFENLLKLSLDLAGDLLPNLLVDRVPDSAPDFMVDWDGGLFEEIHLYGLHNLIIDCQTHLLTDLQIYACVHLRNPLEICCRNCRSI